MTFTHKTATKASNASTGTDAIGTKNARPEQSFLLTLGFGGAQTKYFGGKCKKKATPPPKPRFSPRFSSIFWGEVHPQTNYFGWNPTTQKESTPTPTVRLNRFFGK